MLPIQQLFSHTPLQSPSLTSSRYRSNNPNLNLSQQSATSFQQFKQQIQTNYKHSASNQIYTFPLSLDYCISLISSDSSIDEMDGVGQEGYDLNQQNRGRYPELEKEWRGKEVERERKRIQVEHQREMKRREVREREERNRKGYQRILKFSERMSKSGSKSISKGKEKKNILLKKGSNTKKKESKRSNITEIYHIPVHYLKDRSHKEQLQESRVQVKLRAKSNRLKTQPDQSFKSTFRKPVGDFKFGIFKNSEF